LGPPAPPPLYVRTIPILGPLAAGPLITLNTNIIIVNAPPHSWALISSCDFGWGRGVPI